MVRNTNQLGVVDIYGRSRCNIYACYLRRGCDVAGGLGEDLFRAVGRQRQVCYRPQPDAMLRSLREEVMPGDLLLTLGAGNVWRIGEDFLKGRAD